MPRRRHKPATTHWVLIVGLVVQQSISLLAELGATGLGHGSHWYPVTLAVLGAVVQALSLMGFTRARAAVELTKLAGMEPEPEPAPVKA